MQRFVAKNTTSRWQKREKAALAASLLLFVFAGCGGDHTAIKSSTSSSGSTSVSGPQKYLAPVVYGTSNQRGSTSSLILTPQTYSLDDKVPGAFSQSTYVLNPPVQEGPQVLNVGNLSIGQRGLRSLGLMVNYQVDANGASYAPVTYDPPKTGNYAVEAPGQLAGLIQLAGQPVAPLVAATVCPNFSSPQTYEYLTIPAPMLAAGQAPQPFGWDPTKETAYGTVDISTKGSTVTFQNIDQYTLPSVGGSGRPSQPSTASLSGACGATFYGQSISVPGELIIKKPGTSTAVPPQALIGIGANVGLLVEDNGSSGSVLEGTSPALYYHNVLGAGTGAVGLPKPASPMSASTLTGSQYLGFVYGAGAYSSSGVSDWSSHLVSFGFSSTPQNCASIATNKGTLIYGGDYTNDAGVCNVIIDLGDVQSSKINGLFPQAKIWLLADYSANKTGQTISFPAVAITGQLSGKNVIFVLGVDGTQPWAIYLFQSS